MEEPNYILYAVIAANRTGGYTYPNFYSPENYDQALRVCNDLCSSSNFLYVFLEGIEDTGYSVTLMEIPTCLSKQV